ncbi:MAG TPA: hypothetical protein VFH48_12010 [Chloroflexota bacterium]|nr:hypothetical protein [Chloroflexota bacterium]
MSDRTVHVAIDAATVSQARAIAATARQVPLMVLTGRALADLADLADELGGPEAAMRHLTHVATNTGRPIGCNLPTAEGSSTLFVAPKGWTPERLAGFVAGHHAELEAQLGPATARPA